MVTGFGVVRDRRRRVGERVQRRRRGGSLPRVNEHIDVDHPGLFGTESRHAKGEQRFSRHAQSHELQRFLAIGRGRIDHQHDRQLVIHDEIGINRVRTSRRHTLLANRNVSGNWLGERGDRDRSGRQRCHSRFY